MFKILVLASTVAVTPVVAQPVTPTPQCEYLHYMSAAVWSALDDAERNGASKFAIHNIESTLHDTVTMERRVCK
ncbi:hypothetical protein G6M87_10855 [Rhizobium rhizogenes]|uniref:hypothetical protein n=1 Tax=Rhizobium rhizogenes TaxID=359 RepID=UPI00157234F6|nr:hypothetical protein [Rhizobium rhizogenes]NTI22356.1 hypothetical protein [Rhizobium rhizogenes]QTG05944.1 hypothetical protein G6M87_10855 [Rhizobium rhizogenes]